MTGAFIGVFCGCLVCFASIARGIGGLDFRTQGCINTLFLFLTMWAYVLYAQRPNIIKYFPVIVFIRLRFDGQTHVGYITLCFLATGLLAFEQNQVGADDSHE